MWNPLPLFHCGGIVPMFACFCGGHSFIHAGFFDPAVSIRQIEQERSRSPIRRSRRSGWRCSTIRDFERRDLSRIRLILDHRRPERLRSMHERLPQAAVFTSFGATEASAHLALTAAR